MFSRANRPYTEKQVEKSLTALSGWQANKKYTEISKIFLFPNFIAALAFLAKVTVHAEVLDHHPEVQLSYGKLKVTLKTDSSKGLTKKDFELASRIDNLSR